MKTSQTQILVLRPHRDSSNTMDTTIWIGFTLYRGCTSLPTSMVPPHEHMRTGASEDRWMVAPGCDEWLTTWCGLTLGRLLQVQVAAWFALVQVKSGAKGLCLAGPPRSGETIRPDLRDPMASRIKCGPHGGKKSKTKSTTGAGAW
jgi:hypothetical protein